MTRSWVEHILAGGLCISIPWGGSAALISHGPWARPHLQGLGRTLVLGVGPKLQKLQT